MIATAGLLGFRWSTGVLMTLAQEFQDQQMWRLQQGPGPPARETPTEPTLPAPGSVPARRDQPNLLDRFVRGEIWWAFTSR